MQVGGQGLSPYVSCIRNINNLIRKDIHMQRIRTLTHTLHGNHIKIDERDVILMTYGWGWWQAQCPWWQSATWLSAHVQSVAVVHWPACLLQWHKIIWFSFLFFPKSKLDKNQCNYGDILNMWLYCLNMWLIHVTMRFFYVNIQFYTTC